MQSPSPGASFGQPPRPVDEPIAVRSYQTILDGVTYLATRCLMLLNDGLPQIGGGIFTVVDPKLEPRGEAKMSHGHNGTLRGAFAVAGGQHAESPMPLELRWQDNETQPYLRRFLLPIQAPFLLGMNLNLLMLNIQPEMVIDTHVKVGDPDEREQGD